MGTEGAVVSVGVVGAVVVGVVGAGTVVFSVVVPVEVVGVAGSFSSSFREFSFVGPPNTVVRLPPEATDASPKTSSELVSTTAPMTKAASPVASAMASGRRRDRCTLRAAMAGADGDDAGVARPPGDEGGAARSRTSVPAGETRTTVIFSAGFFSSSPTKVMITGVAAAPMMVPGPQIFETTIAATTEEALAIARVSGFGPLVGCACGRCGEGIPRR